jgi:hypothetical protein
MTQPSRLRVRCNEGFQCVCNDCVRARYVQFVDGDCEVQAGWLATAQSFLNEHPTVAVVCGRRRRYPEHSIYNLLCDLEWDYAGEALACGSGDAIDAVDAFVAAQGFRCGFNRRRGA